MNREPAEKRPECLREEVLTDYLEGTLDPVVKSACEVHLIVCDSCRQNLALFMRVLREEVTPEEETTLQQLAAIWDQRDLRPVPVKSRRGAKGIIYVAAGIVAALLLALGLWHAMAPAPRVTMTRALVMSVRPFEPRVAEQPYLKIQEVTRSAGEPVTDVVASEMTRGSADSYEAGKYFLLRLDYMLAIKYLKTAVSEARGVPADVHNDLGVAYLQSKDYAKAEAEFMEALNREPTHKPAVFNLSLVYERRQRLDEARQQWQRYLRLDHDSGWAQEIQKKLSEKDLAEQ